MRPRLFLAMLSLAVPAFAQGGGVTIGGQGFSQADIVDARGLPEIGGGAAILITMSNGASRRLADVTRRSVGRTVPVTVDGKEIAAPMVREQIAGGVIQISLPAWTVEQAAALAKRISGKDPLPDSLDDGP